MGISDAETMEPPPAPSTPVVGQEALIELVNYYRELAHFHRDSVEYHQKLLAQHSVEAEAAEQQLASMEASFQPLITGKESQSITRRASQNQGKTKSSSTKVAKTKKSTPKSTPKKKTNKEKKSTKSPSSRLPESEKLASHKTLVDAVAFCLQESYPQVITAEDIVKHYYPEGLEGETKKRAYNAFRDCLSKGAGKRGWIKASIGKYCWSEKN